MATAAISSQNTRIQIGNGAGTEVFTDIGEIRSFNGPGGQANVIDATNLASTAREKLMGLADEGQLSLDISYVPTDVQHRQLLADRRDKVKRNFKIIFSDTSTAAFAAYVLGFTVTGGVDQLVAATVVLEITGSVAWPT